MIAAMADAGRHAAALVSRVSFEPLHHEDAGRPSLSRDGSLSTDESKQCEYDSWRVSTLSLLAAGAARLPALARLPSAPRPPASACLGHGMACTSADFA